MITAYEVSKNLGAVQEHDTFRILLFGDSQAAGSGVSDGQRFGDQLEEMVHGVEVYNFGLPATGTDQQYRVFREFASGIEHDLVLVCPWVENIERNVATHAVFGREATVLARPHFVLGHGGQLELRNVPVPKEAVPEHALPANARPYDFSSWQARMPANSRVQMARRAPSPIRRLARGALTRLGPRALAAAFRVSRKPLLPMYHRADGPGWLLLRGILERWASETQLPMVICPDRSHSTSRASRRHGTTSPASERSKIRRTSSYTTSWRTSAATTLRADEQCSWTRTRTSVVRGTWR